MLRATSGKSADAPQGWQDHMLMPFGPKWPTGRQPTTGTDRDAAVFTLTFGPSLLLNWLTFAGKATRSQTYAATSRACNMCTWGSPGETPCFSRTKWLSHTHSTIRVYKRERHAS